MSLELSILLPVRNEGMNLRIMLKILQAVLEYPHEVLVIHDSAEDDSIPAVKAMQSRYENLRLVHNTLGRGVINALRAGVKEAQGKYILIFAADEVGPVLAIEDMMDLVHEGCEFVSCTRYAHGGRRLGGSVIGGLLSRLANFLFYRVSGSQLTDCTTGIKLMRKSLFESWQLEAKPIGWGVAFELGIRAQLENIQVGEVPIISIDRLYGGKSTFKLGPWFIEYLKWFVWGTRALWGAKQRASIVVRPSRYFIKGV